MKNINFVTESENIDAIPCPRPAVEFLPDWYKNMSSKMDENKPSHINNPTMKMCPGIYDILRIGYIVPAWCDFYIDLTSPEQGVGFESSSGEDFLSVFPISASRGFSFPEDHESLFLKFRTPWKIQSDDNLSVLVSQPKYQYNLPYTMYEGSMDVGPFIADINFIISVKKGSFIEFKRGDPLIHLIPFETNSFKSTIKPIDDSIYAEWKRQMRAMKSYALGGFLKTFHKTKKFI
jgi:hypothetical protein